MTTTPLPSEPRTTPPPQRGALPIWPLRRAWVVLTWERLQQSFWPAAAIAGAGLAVLLSGLPARLSGWLHVVVLTVLALAFLVALGRGLSRWQRPRAAEVRDRLESVRPAGAHRPWTAATDALALGQADPATQRLWQLHQARMRTAARSLRPGPAQAGLAGRDPLAIRFVPVLLLVVALALAWPDPLGRMVESLSPRFGPPPPPPRAQVWLTPPEYTAAVPTYLQSAGPEDPTDGQAPHSETPLRVPEGTTLLALLRGGEGPAHLDLGNAGALRLDDAATDAGTTADAGAGQRLTRRLGRVPIGADAPTAPAPALALADVESVTRLRLEQAGRVLIDRPLSVTPDQPPSIAWTAPPGPAGEEAPGQLTLAYAAQDDHGLSQVSVRVAPAGGQALGAPPELDLPAMTGADRSVRRDLSAHPWAGTAVTVTLRAKDALGQSATTAAADVVLPERRFSNPLAQGLIDIRRDLVINPGRARAAATGIDLLAEDTAAYGDRLAVFLSLKAVSAALDLARDALATERHLEQLWDIATALEDGSLGDTRRQLAQAREALRQALDRGADRAEIERLAEALREAMDRFLETLAESLPLARLPMIEMPMPQGVEPFDPQAIDRMLEQLGELSDLGAQEAAEAMLERLEQTLRQLEGARPPSQAEMQALADMAEMAARLRDLVERQSALHEETFRLDPRDAFGSGDRMTRAPLPGMRPDESLGDWLQRQQAPAPRSSPPANSEDMARLEADQTAIRRALESLMADLADRLGAVPESLGTANLAMREAEEALRRGDAAGAAEAQGRALEALTQGQQQAMGQMMGPGGQSGAGRGPGMGFGLIPLRPGGGRPGGLPGMGQGMGQGMGRDPLDRPVQGGAPDDGSIQVPTEPETRRAHDILRELRRRANEAGQDGPVRDYLDRLLEPF